MRFDRRRTPSTNHGLNRFRHGNIPECFIHKCSPRCRSSCIFIFFWTIYSGRRIRSSQRFKRDTEKHFAKHEENFAARMVLYCRVHNPDLFTHFSAKRSDRTFYCDGNVAVSKSSLSKTSMGLIKSR